MIRHFASRQALFAAASLAALAVGSGAAMAQDAATTVDDLIIRVNGLEQTLPLELSLYGNDIEIIDSDQIRDQTYIDTSDALRMQISGLYLVPRNGPFSYSDLALQGSRTGDVLWLVDGVRINNRLYTSTSPADTLPSNMIERIEVLKGGQSLFYGTAAAAGVINVVTRSFSDEPGGQISAGIDSNEGYHVSGYGRGAAGRHQYVVYGSVDDSEGYRPYTRIEPSATDRNRSYDVRSYGVKYGYDFSDDLNVNVRYQHTDALIDYLDVRRVAEGSNERDEDILSLNADWRISDSLQLFLKAYLHDWDSYYTTIWNTPGNPAAPPTVIDLNTGWWFTDRGINLLGEFTPGGPFDYLVGYDYQTYEGQDDVLLIARQTETVNAAIFQLRSNDQLSERARFAVGLRQNDTGESSTTVWNASGRFDITDSLYVEASGGTSFVLPSAEQLYGNDPCCEVGNPNLEAEESENYNISVGGRAPIAGGAVWQLTWFDRTIDNLITTDGVMYINDVGEVTAQGWEAQALVDLNPEWKLSGSYTHTEAESSAAPGVQIARIPEDFAKVQLAYQPMDHRFGGSVSALWTGEVSQSVSGFGVQPYGDYVVVDLAAHYYLDDERRNQLTVRVENLFDEEYATRLGSAPADDGSGLFQFGQRGVPQTFHLSFTRRFGAE